MLDGGMATERNIFEQYCDVAINEILEKGYIRSDFNWDVYRRCKEKRRRTA